MSGPPNSTDLIRRFRVVRVDGSGGEWDFVVRDRTGFMNDFRYKVSSHLSRAGDKREVAKAKALKHAAALNICEVEGHRFGRGRKHLVCRVCGVSPFGWGEPGDLPAVDPARVSVDTERNEER